MKKNVGNLDVVIRTIVAMVIFYFAYETAIPWNYLLYAVGSILIVTAVRGICPLFSVFGISTNKSKKD